MYTKQKQVMESFVRVGAFLDLHPANGVPGYASAREMFTEVMRRLREYAGEQVSGRELGRAGARRQADQMALLFDSHIRPIVTIARAQIQPPPDVGLPAALRMPKVPLSPMRLLAACDGMIEAARQFEPVFVANGLPEDFLAQFTSARNALERVMGERATQVSTHVAARAGLRVELRRGRYAVDRLDALVRAAFRGDVMLLTAWRSAKRVHQAPGGAGARATEEDVRAAA